MKECGPLTPVPATTNEPITIDQSEKLAEVFKALADPVRLRVYVYTACYARPTVCACHLPDVFGISQPTLSYHLKRLVTAGLLEREVRGRWAHFSPTARGLRAFKQLEQMLPNADQEIPPMLHDDCCE